MRRASRGWRAQGSTLGVYEFTHALVRDVLYAGVPAAARRSRHRRIAEAIESIHTVDIDNHLNELADHYALAVPDADASLALAYALRSGRHALGVLAYEEAARRFERAVDLAATGAGDEEARVDALLALGDARMRAGDWTAATAAYDDAAASARGRHRPDELARAALGRGAGLSGFEVRLYELDLLREALDGLGDSGGDLRGWVLARLSVAESYLQDPAVRLERSKQAVAEARTLGDAKLLGYALSSYCDSDRRSGAPRGTIGARRRDGPVRDRRARSGKRAARPPVPGRRAGRVG